jgi:hypothetical protein
MVEPVILGAFNGSAGLHGLPAIVANSGGY